MRLERATRAIAASRPINQHAVVAFVGEPQFLAAGADVQVAVAVEGKIVAAPVIAWPNGSVPEVIADGVSGRIVDSIEPAAGAARHAAYMDRRKVRAEFEQRFTAERMASAYIVAYRICL